MVCRICGMYNIITRANILGTIDDPNKPNACQALVNINTVNGVKRSEPITKAKMPRKLTHQNLHRIIQ